MKPTTAEPTVDALTEDLQDLIVREAYVRQHQAALAAALATLREKEAEFSRTRPPFLAFRKGAKENYESNGQKLKDDVVAAERELAKCDSVLRQCGRAIEMEFEQSWRERSETWRNAVAAEKLIPDWEQALGLLDAALKHFITALGVARNQMASGYNPQKGVFAAGAKEAFERAQSAARAVEAEAAVPNQLAKRFAELVGVAPPPVGQAANPPVLPTLPFGGLAKQVSVIAVLTLEDAQARIRGLLEDAERNHGGTLPRARATLAEMRAVRAAEWERRITAPLAEFRAQANAVVDASQFSAVWESMVSRFPA